MGNKYLVWPGHVRSQVDGDRHYITAMQLISLYRVRPRDCIIAEMLSQKDLNLIRERNPGIIDLYPRYNGNYTLPENTMGNIVYNRVSVGAYIVEQIQEKAVAGIDVRDLMDKEGQAKFLLVWDIQGKCRVYVICDINHHFSVPKLDGRFNNYSVPMHLIPTDNDE
ncbi:hypothetical protein [Yersinia ruckeri]|uniref:hypothetical protein n=1 Tax=Yersinia ruckeri TaxID=29486 RepID=UPI00223845A3|nr:hypothetical protein [Yersinia ruckeri]MCW6598892.1 hypothetical protein [Yersinia ruckeri]